MYRRNYISYECVCQHINICINKKKTAGRPSEKYRKAGKKFASAERIALR